MSTKTEKRNSRALRVRKGLGKTRPRLSVFRSGRHIWVQLIDDNKGVTVAAFSSKKLGKNANRDVAREVGKKIAEIAKVKNIESVVLDRGSYTYHGQVQALAEGAREGGLKF